MKNKVALHYLILIFSYIIFYIIGGLIHYNSLEELTILDFFYFLKGIYTHFIDSMFCKTGYHNYYIMRIIAYISLILLIINNIAFICKQNKFTITMFYFWNGIVFGIPNLYIFGFLFILITTR